MDVACVKGKGVDSVDQATKHLNVQESKDIALKYVIVVVFY